MTDLKSTVYWEIYADVFAFHKKFAEVREDDSYWEQVISEINTLCKKYEGVAEAEFAKQLALTVLDELERVYRKMPKKHE